MPTPVFQLAFGEKQQFEDGNGNPRVGAKLFVYIAGTTTKATTYQQTDGVATNTNPITLDGDGALPYGLYVESGLYDVVLAPPTDTDPPSSPIWTRPDLTPFNDTSLTLDEWVAANGTPTWTGASSFTLTGDQTASATPRRRVRVVDSGGTKYGTILTSSFAVNTTVTVAVDTGSLASPIISVEYGLLTSVNSAIPWLSDDQFNVADPANASKRGGFDVSGVSASNRRLGRFPDYNFDLGNLCPGIGPIPFAGRTAQPGWLNCNQAPVSRTTYSRLFDVIVPSIGTFTVTIASPGVFTLNAHGFAAGDPVYFTTTGALPTGLSANTIYYVISAGLTANAFQVSLLPGGTAVNTSGTQSGTHTCRYCPYGLGNGSTTFNLPTVINGQVIAAGTGVVTQTITSVTAAGNAVAVGENLDKWITGMPVVVTGASGFVGLVNGSYWIVRASSSTIQIATSLANAQNGTVVTVTGTGSATFTSTMSTRVAGQTGGWDEHAMTLTELLAHTHSAMRTVTNPTVIGASAYSTGDSATSSTGGNAVMTVKNPYLVVPMFIISY